MSRFQSEFGIGFRQSDHLVFFGGKGCSEQTLCSQYPEMTFQRIRQTHSSIVVESSSVPVEADAHFASEKNVALVVATADCIPLMVYCRQTKKIAAVHAGWKGIQGNITKNTLQALIANGSTMLDFQFYVGPHIMQKSFETDADVFQALAAANPALNSGEFSSFANNKWQINLEKIMEFQIKNIIKRPLEIYYANVDTKTDERFHSYRRGKHSSERNLSFIARL